MAKSMSFHIILISLVARLELDDPLDAVAVHGGGGIVGLLCVPWFMYAGQAEGQRGIFWDGHTSFPWLVLGHNIAGAVAIMAWAGTQSTLLFGGLKMLGILRVSGDELNKTWFLFAFYELSLSMKFHFPFFLTFTFT